MLHTKFCGNRPAGSGKEDFKKVFTIYGHGGHLGHVTSIMSSDFHFLVPESFHKQVAQRATIAHLRANFTFSNCKSKGDDDPWGLANLDPRGMIGRIYVGYH